MDQLEFFDIPSPCIGVCQAGKSGYCVGCFRSREERLYWTQINPQAKRAIVKACQRRKRVAERSGIDSLPIVAPMQGSLFGDES